MGWITMSLRRSELQASISDQQLQLMQLSRQMRKLANLSNAIGDGKINPNEIASLGGEFFGEGLDFMAFSHDAACELAQAQTDQFVNDFGWMTKEQYAITGNSAATTMHLDQDGNLDTNKMYADFYEEALKQYANEVALPRLNELEKELENKKAGIETQLESEKAELESVKQSVSESIQSSTIKL